MTSDKLVLSSWSPSVIVLVLASKPCGELTLRVTPYVYIIRTPACSGTVHNSLGYRSTSLVQFIIFVNYFTLSPSSPNSDHWY